MHKLTFFPLGNADCCRIDLEAGEKILFDYADMRCAEDDSDLRIAATSEATGINGNGYITANAFVNSKLRGFTARCHYAGPHRTLSLEEGLAFWQACITCPVRSSSIMSDVLSVQLQYEHEPQR